jgi:hypothetical protein
MGYGRARRNASPIIRTHSDAAGLAAGIITFVDGIDCPVPGRPCIVEVGLRHNAPIAMNAQILLGA